MERLPDLVISDSAGSSETGAQMHATSVDPVKVGCSFPAPARSWSTSRSNGCFSPGTRATGGWRRPGACRWVSRRPRQDGATFPVIVGVRYSIPGDRARHRADGQIELLGRDSVTVNSGGEKIFVEEVERAIAGHPAVADVVVTGRPSERWGSEVVAIVQPAPGADADAASIPSTPGPHRPLQTAEGRRVRRAHSAVALGQGGLPVGSRPGSRRPNPGAGRGDGEGPGRAVLTTPRLVLRPFKDADRQPFSDSTRTRSSWRRWAWKRRGRRATP